MDRVGPQVSLRSPGQNSGISNIVAQASCMPTHSCELKIFDVNRSARSDAKSLTVDSGQLYLDLSTSVHVNSCPHIVPLQPVCLTPACHSESLRQTHARTVPRRLFPRATTFLSSQQARPGPDGVVEGCYGASQKNDRIREKLTASHSRSQKG